MSEPALNGAVVMALYSTERLWCLVGAGCAVCLIRPCPCRDCELVHCPGRGKGECPVMIDVSGAPLPELDVGDVFDEGDGEE